MQSSFGRFFNKEDFRGSVTVSSSEKTQIENKAAAADSAIVLYSLPPLDLTAAAPHPPPSVAPADISIWSPVDVRHWLKTLPFFDSVENLYDVDGATLLKLNAKDITSLGVKEDIAERMRKVIERVGKDYSLKNVRSRI